MLATEFGVSPVTASLAIAGLKSEGLLSTRQGSGTFVSHASHQPKKKGQSYKIGLSYPIASNSYAGNPKAIHPVITDYVEGLESAFAKNKTFSLNLLPQEANIGFEKSRIASMWKDGQLDGTILAGEQFKEDIQWLLENNIPSVILNAYSANPLIPYIKANHMAGYRLLTSHLGKTGHRKMLYITYLADDELMEHGPYNYIHSALNAGIEFSNDSILTLDNTHTGQSIDYNPIIEKAISMQPDCVICCDEIIMRNFIWACMQKNIDIPAQISVTSMSDIQANAFPMKVTTLNTTEMLKECARLGGELLARSINGENITGKSVEIVPVIIHGESVMNRIAHQS